MRYELFYLIAGSKEAELEAIKAGVQEIVTAEGGVFEEKEVVEKRKLAYAIKHENRGLFVARRFEIADPQKLQEITRKLNLNTNILRSVISRADELPELKTKEERISAAGAKQERKLKEVKKTAAPVVSTKKSAPEEAVKTEEKAVEEKPTTEQIIESKKVSEDIDKKLEEILNI